MRVLIADDEPVTRLRLTAGVTALGHEAEPVADGAAAWAALARPDGPPLAILDWEMPGASGPEVCRRARAELTARPPYLVLLTARAGTGSLVEGLRAGADDYLTKPPDPAELEARLGVGVRTLALQARLAERVAELERAAAHVRQLQGLLPVCAWCKRVREGENYWQRVEDYLKRLGDVQITHGMCPDCLAREAAGIG